MSAAFTLEGFDLDAFVASTLAEDLGPDGRDVTSEAVIPAYGSRVGCCWLIVADIRSPIMVSDSHI